MVETITAVGVSKTTLEKLPAGERSALLLMGHASNEIRLLRKIMLVAIRNGTPANKITDHVEAGQVLIILRLLLGKCYEAYLLYCKRIAPLRGEYAAHIDEARMKAADELGSYFKDDRLAAIRNQLSFHYKDDKDLIDAQWRSVPDNDPWEFYLSETHINTFYYASELVVTGALLKLAAPKIVRGVEDHLELAALAFSEVCRLANETSDKLLGVFDSYIAAILSKHLGGLSVRDEEITDCGKLSRLSFPFFWDADDYLRCMEQARVSGQARRPNNG